MKNIIEKNKKILAIITIILIIIAGIIVAVKGFNKELRYQKAQKIDVYIEHEIDKEKVKGIAKEVFGCNYILQTIEIYEDMITVRAKTITEEQKNDFVNKLKENYEFKQTVEETKIENIDAVRLVDLYKKYVFPFALSGILVLIYMTIRYFKNGISKVIIRTISYPIIFELVLFSILAITRFPMGRFTPVLFVLTYILSIWYVVNLNEKDGEIKETEE